MTITVYTCMSDRMRVDKALENPVAITGELYNDTSLLDPVIVVDTATLPPYSNYCQIHELGRYYYIQAITLATNSLLVLHCHIDVLMTWADYIKRVPAILDRAQAADHANVMLPDQAMRTYAQPHVIQRVFPSGLTGSTEVLVLASKGSFTSSNLP